MNFIALTIVLLSVLVCLTVLRKRLTKSRLASVGVRLVQYGLMILVLLTGTMSVIQAAGFGDRFVFVPTKSVARYWNPDRAEFKPEDVYYQSPSGNKIHAWRIKPHLEPGQKPEYYFIYFHGNAGNLTHHYYYNAWLAKNLNAKYHSKVTEDMYLPFLPKGTPEFDSYLREMQYCLEWAQCNRQEMMNRTKEVLLEAFSRAEFGEEIDIHHNYVALERHGGLDLYVHRKGAVCTGDTITDENGTTSFTPNTVIIPGSMGTCSYICSGIQSEEAFNSCSHGAGRALSRTEARQLDIKAEVEMLDSLGIVHGIRSKQDLEECPSAYKDINQVLQDEADLVNPIVKLTPIAVLKG